MTKEQDDKFELYGCASRCLIALANARGDKLTKAEFIDKYAPKYWVNDNRCGIFSRLGIAEVAIDLQLASTVEETNDFARVREAIKNKSIRAIFVITEKRKEEDGTLIEYHHCTIVNAFELRGEDFQYLMDVDYISGHASGPYIAESDIAPLIPTFLLFHH